MMIFGNLLLLGLVFYFFAILIEKYNQLILDKYRFSYFALRDRLATMVINGELKETSREYKTVIDAINFHIKTVEDVSIHKLVAALVHFHNSPEEKWCVKSIQKGHAHPALCEIMIDYLDLTHSLLLRNSKMQTKLLRWMTSTKRSDTLMHSELMQERQKAMQNIEHYRESCRQAMPA